MSTFYLLPARSVLADRLADSLQGLLPGLDWNVEARHRLAELVGQTLAMRSDVYIVHRDDLPNHEPPERALVDGFGANPGDEIVEIRHGGRPGEFHSRRWRINSLSSSA